MASQPSNEERNYHRLQAWEQRKQESCQAKEQNPENTPLFGQPYKTNKEDELSNRIQRMLGSFDDNTATEPFIVPSSSNFPLTNSLHPKSDLLHQSPAGSCAESSLRSHCIPPRSQDEDGPLASNPDHQMINSSLQNNSLKEKTFAADVCPLPRSELHSLEAKGAQPTESDERQTKGSPENACPSSENNMLFFTKGNSSPPNRTFNMPHSQSFNPPLSHNQTNTAALQKPTAYVRPMDGPEVLIESSPDHCRRLTDVSFQKSIPGNASTLPQFLETMTSDIQHIEHILSEMTSPWPPLLPGIHSPHTSKAQSSTKEENPPTQETWQTSTDPSLSRQRSPVACSSDSEMDSGNGTDDPPQSYSPKSQPVAFEDCQMDTFGNFSQNYGNDGQRAESQSLKCSSLKDGLRPSTVSPVRNSANQQRLNQNTVTLPKPQLCSAQEHNDSHNRHKSYSSSCPSISPLPPDSRVNNTQVDRNNGDGMNFDKTPSQGPEPASVKKHHKQSKSGTVVFESELTLNHDRNKDQQGLILKSCENSITSSQPAYSERLPQASKSGAEQKSATDLLQEEPHVNGCPQGCSSTTLSLIVKINLSLLSKIPRTMECLKTDNRPDKARKVKSCRKNARGHQLYPKKKPKLQSCNPSAHTARNVDLSEASEKRSKKKDKISLASCSARDNSQRGKDSCKNKPSLHKEEVNSPKCSSGNVPKQSTVKKPLRESSSNRPLLRFEDRLYPVKHYIKEAKRLKHKADAETDKLPKIFHYLDGALFFIESGIAMERDPQISMSSYRMFSETVDLIKFVLTLTKSEEPSPTENDILALCLKCQALLQMAMYRHKEKPALLYSKTLIDHFNNSSQSPPNPASSVNSFSGSAADVGGALSRSVRFPQEIGQMTLSYVNITTLFLSAHALWEQADVFTYKGSGLLTELNKALGALSLSSTMSSMVCYMRQGLHWLQMDYSKVK